MIIQAFWYWIFMIYQQAKSQSPRLGFCQFWTWSSKWNRCFWHVLWLKTSGQGTRRREDQSNLGQDWLQARCHNGSEEVWRTTTKLGRSTASQWLWGGIFSFDMIVCWCWANFKMVCHPCQVFCGKIPRDVYEDELIPLFEKCGTIWDLRLMMDPLTNLNRGYAFVTFTTTEAAQEAVNQVMLSSLRLF